MPAPSLPALFPPFGLVVSAGDLTLRLLRDEDIPEYAALLRRPIFADEGAPHVFPWYVADPEDRIANSLQFQWMQRSAISPGSWSLQFGVWRRGELLGSQDVSAVDFARRRTVTSGSWLTLSAQGQGTGKLMRQAMLVLALDHLGARRAESAAVIGNEASFGVSRACGYRLNGDQVQVDGEHVNTHQRFVLTPEDVVRPEVAVEVEGLTPRLRRMLGAQEGAAD